jgi:predicted RNA binding protein YcfA (HicA-like mRNA interferase family)
VTIGDEQEASTQSCFGFRFSRKRGSHHIYVHPSASELLNLQEVGGKAKPYQIRQFLKLVEKYNLELGED